MLCKPTTLLIISQKNKVLKGAENRMLRLSSLLCECSLAPLSLNRGFHSKMNSFRKTHQLLCFTFPLMLEQPGVVEGVLAHGREVGTR